MMARPGGIDYNPEKLNSMIDDFMDSTEHIMNRVRVSSVEAFIDDLQALTREEFIRKYGVTRREYDELIAALEDMKDEDMDEAPSEDETDMRGLIYFLGLAVIYLTRDAERDAEIEAYRRHAEDYGRDLYLNWVTMGDDHVCETCQEYEDASPYRVEEFPHIPHPFCRCHPEPCDENGRPIDDLSEYSETELEYYDEIMEDFGDVGIDFEAVPPPPPYYYI